jgi:hypothetical protein
MPDLKVDKMIEASDIKDIRDRKFPPIFKN